MLRNVILAVALLASVAYAKGKLNLNYKASNDENTMYRALQIRKPSPELSGEYKCLVSTFSNEVSLSKRMVVFVPQRDFRLFHTLDVYDREDNSVEQVQAQRVSVINVTCVAEGVFPEPKITLLSASEPVENPSVKTRVKNGLYDVTASFQLESTNIRPTDHAFECELSIPQANYTVRKVILVTPDEPSTTTIESDEESSSTEPYFSTSTTEDLGGVLYPDSLDLVLETTTPDYQDWNITSSTLEYATNDTLNENLGSNAGGCWFSSKVVLLGITIFYISRTSFL